MTCGELAYQEQRGADVLAEKGVDFSCGQLGEATVAAAAGAKAARVARPDEVLAATGFEPGGVAPFPARGVSQVLMAEELLVHDRVWIGAGSERHMAGLSPLDLARLTQARTADLT